MNHTRSSRALMIQRTEMARVRVCSLIVSVAADIWLSPRRRQNNFNSPANLCQSSPTAFRFPAWRALSALRLPARLLRVASDTPNLHQLDETAPDWLCAPYAADRSSDQSSIRRSHDRR